MAEELHSDEKTWQDAISQVEMETGQKVSMEFDEAVEVYRNCEISTRIPRTLWVREMMLMASKLVGVFQEMTPNVLYIPVWRNAEFVTGDRPILAAPRTKNPSADWKWFRNPEADLFFPVSSRRCLVLNYDSKPKVLMVSRKQVASINHFITLNCTRIVISQEPRFIWLRECGTISESIDELMEFVHHTPESGAVSGDSWNVLRGES